MTDSWALVTVGALAALGPTIASLAAWRNSSKVNKAVNGRAPEAPTISQDVTAIRISQERLERRFDAHLRDHYRTRGYRGR